VLRSCALPSREGNKKARQLARRPSCAGQPAVRARRPAGRPQTARRSAAARLRRSEDLPSARGRGV